MFLYQVDGDCEAIEMENQQNPADRFSQSIQGVETNRRIPCDSSADFKSCLQRGCFFDFDVTFGKLGTP